MTAAKVFFVSLALSCLLHSAAACWGAVAVSESLRPDASFVSQFPASPSVVVGAGESVNDKISACDGAVGSGGYCRVKITGTPSASGISISRSRTMIEGSPGVVLTGSGDMSFVYIGDNTNSIVIQDLEIRGHSTSYHAGVEVHGSDIASIVVKNCKIHSFMAGSGDAHAIIVRGTAGTDAAAVNNIIIESNTVYDMNLGSSEAIAINGNVRRWLIKGNSVRDVNNIAIDAIGSLSHVLLLHSYTFFAHVLTIF